MTVLPLNTWPTPCVFPVARLHLMQAMPMTGLLTCILRGRKKLSLKRLFRSLFSPVGSLRPLDYQFSAFGLRIALEGLQSLVSDSDDHDLAVGVPQRSDVCRALAQVHETISLSIHFSPA